MWQPQDLSNLTVEERWKEITSQLEHLISEGEPLITALSNTAALLYNSLENVNWAGFYLFDGAKLILGPFGGLPACTQIPLNKGVCGTAASQKQTVVVPDVEEFPGHIACDSASRSEIVLPITLANEELFGVLDIDSPNVNRFSEEDRAALEKIVSILTKKIEAIKAQPKLASLT